MKLYQEALLLAPAARDFLSVLGAEAKAARPTPAAVTGLPREVLEALAKEGVRRLTERGRPSLVLAKDAATCRRLAEEWAADGLRAAAYLPREYILYHVTVSHEAEKARLAVLAALLRGTLDVVITTPEAALGYTVPRARLAAATRTLRVGDVCTPEELCTLLAGAGYFAVKTVEAAGQFAHRGGIVDFAAEDGALPVRIEFFGDEVDRIGHFDPLDQRLCEPLGEATVFPARELLPDDAARTRILEEMKKREKKQKGEEERAALAAEAAIVRGGGELPFADKYIGQIYPEGECLLSYFEPPATVFLFDSAALLSGLGDSLALTAKQQSELILAGALPAGYASSLSLADYERFLSAAFAVYMNIFASPPAGLRLSGLFGFSCRRTPDYLGKEELLLQDMKDYREKQYRVLLYVRTAGEREEYTRLFRDRGYTVTAGDCLPSYGEVAIRAAVPPAGFELPAQRVAVLSLTDAEASRPRRRPNRYRTRAKGAGERILSYAELSPGDYVVHAVHGIGRFLGMQTLTVGGATADYITLQYAGQEKLHLRADKLDMVARYIGGRSEEGAVKLSRIGGSEWGRAKSRARAAARDMAKELLALYAERERREGYAFPPEGELEAEFAAAFEFEETEPQRQAIAEIMADMSAKRPMDRLLCGDVGFGKTEVALRAAFRAAAAGKQVAILVPTTILALQHYNTIRARMRGYPLTVEMLSRLRTPRETAAVLRRLARGEVDIVVGTHALLSKSVAFRDLGLLIVDEEQRFGVGQKEKIKEMAKGIDVLTLTATPIPRTLNMAMNGIRDMSVLDEAPADRFPVATYVMEHDDLMVAEAMRRELSRGGQVLYLYNRVESIYRVYDRIVRDLPTARVAVAHGRMEREEMEKIWQDLVMGELDILVATTIIENGVDLPNANTLIIEDADRLGLAQLHQLRGRVGRSGRRAYAYCTYRPGKALSEIAVKRLSAIREYCEFGAGFRVALRDLEIRGAGNLLGAEQHGHIDSVGYDMYVRLLSEAVSEERGEVREEITPATVDYTVDAYIPESYIGEDTHRMDMYKKMALIRNDEDRADVLDEFCDRFGEPPETVLILLDVATARAIATRRGISRVEIRGREIKFLFAAKDLAAWSEVVGEMAGIRILAAPTPQVIYRAPAGEAPAAAARRILALLDKKNEKGDIPQ